MTASQDTQISIRWDGIVRATTVREAFALLKARLSHKESGLKLTFTMPGGQQVKLVLPANIIEIPMEDSMVEHKSRVKFPQEGRIG